MAEAADARGCDRDGRGRSWPQSAQFVAITECRRRGLHAIYTWSPLLLRAWLVVSRGRGLRRPASGLGVPGRLVSRSGVSGRGRWRLPWPSPVSGCAAADGACGMPVSRDHLERLGGPPHELHTKSTPSSAAGIAVLPLGRPGPHAACITTRGSAAEREVRHSFTQCRVGRCVGADVARPGWH